METFTILLAVLGFLWFADELLTILDVKKFGLNREENPVVKWMVKHGVVYFTIFKVLTFAVFLGLIFTVESLHHNFALLLTGAMISLYTFVVVRNFEIYEGLN